MRPIKLIMQAFGPYKDRVEIPFENLTSEIFLISGDTGSGKTTIFDAICYALFDSPSGSNRNNLNLKSHFAQDNTESYVELSFLFRGEIYKVSRTPSYKIIKANSKTTVVPEKAQLILPDDRVIIKTREVNKYITELLGLNMSQFSQIALLAQGEFLKLLNASIEERADIFRKVFRTNDFLLFQTKIKERSLWYKNSLEDIKKSLLQYVFQIETGNEKINSIKEKFLAENNFVDFDMFFDLLKKEDKTSSILLNKTELEIEQMEKESYNLKTLLKTIDEKFNLISNLNDLLVEIEKRKCTFERIKNEHSKLKEKNLKVENLLLEIQKSKDDYQKSIEIVKMQQDYENIQNNAEKLKEEINQVKNDICNLKLSHLSNLCYEKEQLQMELEYKQSEFLNYKNEFNLLSVEFNKSYEQYLSEQAGVIAKSLKDGRPCPVCGSLEHPKPNLNFDICIDKNLLDDKKRKLDNINKIYSALSVDCGVLKEKITHKKEEFEKNSTLYNISKDSVKSIKGYSDFSFEILSKENLKNELETKYSKLILDMQDKNARLESLKSTLLTNDIDLILINHNKLEFELKKTKKEIENVKNEFDEANILINKLLSKKELLEKQLENYSEVNENDKNSISELEKKINNELVDMKNRLSVIKVNKTMNENIIVELEKKSKEFFDMEKKYTEYKLISDCANGALQGKRKIAFEQFIQGYYLDRVLFEANKRLKIMTNSRYQLLRKKEGEALNSKTGLDLEVMDFYTYKTRSTKTLSGGESFCAALALALGLSDCICSETNAVSIDAMFIDEGFGSLDADSMELAMDVIMNLSSKSRLVGIISHIESLKSLIPDKIIACKSESGSYIKMTF